MRSANYSESAMLLFVQEGIGACKYAMSLSWCRICSGIS